MFTGIVEYVGTVLAATTRGALVQFAIACGPLVQGVRLGDSIAINGTDLTVTAIDGSTLHFDMVRETAGITNLGALRSGSKVNLERALRADGRYDGHIVQGHIDGTGTIQPCNASKRMCVWWSPVLRRWPRAWCPRGRLPLTALA